jgi:hypothetical protein
MPGDQPPGRLTPLTFSVYRAYWLIDSVGSSYMTSAPTTSAFSPISFSSRPFVSVM